MIRIVLIATGLGHIRRGFEVSALEWTRALRTHGGFEVLLLSGGRNLESKTLPCLRQTGLVASLLRRLGLIKDGARLQQRSFAPFAKLAIQKFQPDFVWLQEGTLASDLQNFKNRAQQKWQVVFCNGAPVSAEFCRQFDLVVNLTPSAHDEILRTGYDSERTVVIPHPVHLQSSNDTTSSWRKRFNMPESSQIVLCVAAWNSHHKRIDYLIREVAEARRSNPHLILVLCGQPTQESQTLKALGTNLLGDHIRWLTLNSTELTSAYQAADVFVLASQNEAFGAVIVEAALAKLPILCNQFDAAKFILGDDYAGLIDMRHPGALCSALLDNRLIASLPDLSPKMQERFSGESLSQQLDRFLTPWNIS
jgi:1,2-diacylglycerol 3-alpha-glucosyltransferase